MPIFFLFIFSAVLYSLVFTAPVPILYSFTGLCKAMAHNNKKKCLYVWRCCRCSVCVFCPCCSEKFELNTWSKGNRYSLSQTIYSPFFCLFCLCLSRKKSHTHILKRLVLQWFIRNNLLYFVQFRKNDFERRYIAEFFLLSLSLSLLFLLLLLFSFVYVCAMCLLACHSVFQTMCLEILWKMRTFDGVCNIVCLCVLRGRENEIVQ